MCGCHATTPVPFSGIGKVFEAGESRGQDRDALGSSGSSNTSPLTVAGSASPSRFVDDVAEVPSGGDREHLLLHVPPGAHTGGFTRFPLFIFSFKVLLFELPPETPTALTTENDAGGRLLAPAEPPEGRGTTDEATEDDIVVPRRCGGALGDLRV